MTEFLLIRHAVNDFVKTGRLAGWTAGVHLNEDGRAQAAALGVRLAQTRIDAIYASPLERCQETAQAVVAHHPDLSLNTLPEIGEVQYGDWQGGELRQLVRRKRWPMVQAFPSRTQFPNGETMRQSQLRAVDALEKLAEQHPRERVAVVSHADIIKLVLAYYLGVHIDLFQRINVSPASLSTLAIGYMRVMIGQINETSYLPEPAHSGKQMDVGGVQHVRVYSIGEPGARRFFLTMQRTEQASEPRELVFDLEKTQAAILVETLTPFLNGDAPPSEPFTKPDQPPQTAFRAGKIEASQSGDSTSEADPHTITLSIHELTGTERNTAGRITCKITPAEAAVLIESARQAIAGGREN